MHMHRFRPPAEFRTRPLFLLLAGAFILAACGQPAASGDSNDTAAPTNGAADFEFTAYQGGDKLGGEVVQFSQILALGKPVVLNFWAGLCPPCRVEMPDLQAVYEQFDGQVLLVGVDVGPFTGLGSREDGRALLEQVQVSYPAGTTFDPAVLRDYSVLGMPSTSFITPDGEIVRTWTGLLNKAKLTELVEELLATSG